jgi:Ca-activated chloride channel family protein
VYRDGRKYAAEVSDENGEIELNLIPGRYFISFTYARQSIDTTVYIHGFNQHLEISILQTDLLSRIESDTKRQDKLTDHPSNSQPTEETLNPGFSRVIDDISKGTELSTIEFKPNNVVFLVDVSASMKNEGRIELLKIAMVELLDVLRTTDRFSLISYAADADVLIETKSQLDKSACIEAIQNLTASGSTEGAKAIDTAGRKVLQHAIADGNNQLIIATDGAFNEGAALAKKLALRYHRKGVVISVLGIRCGKYTTSEMSELATYGGGRFVAIDTPLDAVDKLVDEIKLSSRK